MLQIIYRTQFKKDYKTMKKRNKDLKKLKEVLNLLENGKPIPKKYEDHPLSGSYVGRRDLHIEPDWILIYKIEENNLILERTGSHSDLFR